MARTSGGKSAAGAAPLSEYRRKRDFSRTAEPSGEERAPTRGSRLHFVIQKHAASHLHFDLRIELDGVMKSWAVPKGPSLDPQVKRLAMEVEDHPISYNAFEGTIPRGQYGGGTVMLWDRGTYEPTGGGGADAVRRGYEKGRLEITMHGKRLLGDYALVRMRRDEGKPQWLLFKRTDEHADPKRDIVAETMTSVTTGRTMEQIASGRGRVWQSNRAPDASEPAAAHRAPGSRPVRRDTKKTSARKSAGRKSTAARRATTSRAKRTRKRA